MRWDLPGKVLIIDNKFSTIADFVTKLTRLGVPVLFWNGKGKPPVPAIGVRVVLLDLDLTDSGEYFLDYTTKVLGKVPGPYALLIYSVNPTESSPKQVEDSYFSVNGRQIPGFVLKAPVKKVVDQNAKDIIDPIRSFLEHNPVLAAILLAEHNLEHAKADSLSELAQKKFESSFRTLVKSLAEDAGSESVTREMILSLTRFQSRSIARTKYYPSLKLLLSKILTQKIAEGSSQLHERIMHLRMYYQPDPEERSWTGDIYKTRFNSETRRYAMIITPSCDISNNKACYLTFCYGFPINERNLAGNQNHVIYSIDDKVKTEKDARKYLVFKGIPSPFYFLDNFVESADEVESSRIIFDFQALQSIRSDEFKGKKWKRLWRLDSPYIEDFLQKFGAHSFRLGTPTPLQII